MTSHPLLSYPVVQDEIVRSFVAQHEHGRSLPNPVREICVGVTEACTPEEFEEVHISLHLPAHRAAAGTRDAAANC